jgi:cytochrome oxidase Cu insertion factor (SCO1/SenC/PrrC family)
VNGAKMKTMVAVLFLVGLYTFANAQENAPTNHTVPPSVGLEIGQQAPAFTLPDQFGHEHSNETLKGSKGTVLLFFRSADW